MSHHKNLLFGNKSIQKICLPVSHHKNLLFGNKSIVCFSPLIAHAKKKTYGGILDAEYVRTYDGDTIFFNLPGLPPLIGTNIGVRVRGIDTPEIRGKCRQEKKLAQDAKLLVQSRLESAEPIHLLNISRGKYFRIVADVVVGGKKLVDSIMEKGLGVRYSGGKKVKNWCS